METRATAVESSIKEAKEINSELEDIVAAQCQALLDCYGVTGIDSDDEKEFLMSDIAESDSDDSLVDNTEEIPSLIPQVKLSPNNDMLIKTLVKSRYNWFEFVEQLERQDCSIDVLDKFFLDLPHMDLSNEALQLVVQSHRAFTAVASDMATEHRAVQNINGEVITESESELDDCTSKEVKCLVIRKQTSNEKAVVVTDYLWELS